MKKDKEGERENGKLLVLALLYKIGSTKHLHSAKDSALVTLLTKCQNLVSKLGLETEKSILQTMEKLKEIISEEPENGDKLLDEYSINLKNKKGIQKAQTLTQSKKPVTNMESRKGGYSADKKIARPASNQRNFVIRGSSKSPQIQNRTTVSSFKERNARSTKGSPIQESRKLAQSNVVQKGKNNFRMSTRKSINDSLLTSQELPQGSSNAINGQIHKEDRVVASQVRREFKESLDNLLKLGEYVKNEIKEMNDEPRLSIVKIKKKTPNIFDDSVDAKAEVFDKEIKSKLDVLLDKQIEWEKNREVLQERLEKIEKAIEKQKNLEDGNQLTPFVTPKNGSGGVSPIDIGNAIVTNSFLSPKLNYTKAKNSSSGSQNFLSAAIRSNSMCSQNHSIVAPSLASEISNKSQVFIKGLEGYSSALKYTLKHLDDKSEESEEEYRQIINCTKDRKIAVGLKICSGGRKEPKRLMMNLYSWSHSTTDLSVPSNLKLVQQDYLDIEQVGFILKRINAMEVLPSHRPVPTFTSMKFFLVHVLNKFITVVENETNFQLDTISIQKVPQSLLAEEAVITKFFEEDHSITLIHLHEKTFRVILRSVAEAENGDGIFADVVFNDFVLSQFFEVVCMLNSQSQKVFCPQYRPTEDELSNLKISPEGCAKSILFIGTPEKKVILYYKEKMTSVLKKIALTLQEHMKSQNYQPTNLLDQNYMFILKLVDWKQELFTVYEVFEKNENDPDFTIKARNNFMSYSNCRKS